MATNWELIFKICNTWVLPFWLLLAFVPRRDIIIKIIMFGGILPVALVYAVLLPLLMTGVLDAQGSTDGNFSTLAGVMNLLSSKGGATIGWIHYLAFDLFVGLWVARNADAHGINRIIQVPILFFTLMAGPLGLCLYLFIRLFSGKKPDKAYAPR